MAQRPFPATRVSFSESARRALSNGIEPQRWSTCRDGPRLTPGGDHHGGYPMGQKIDVPCL